MNFVSKKAIHRRTVLRGIGATMALPLLDAMVPAATAMERTPALPVRRLGYVFMPMGCDITRWTPSGKDNLDELPPILSSLAPVRESVLELLPDHLDVVQVRSETGLESSESDNRGITAIGFSESEGAWNRVDVVIAVEGSAALPRAELVATLDGEPLEVPLAIPQATAGRGGWRYLLPDLIATGQVLRVHLDGADALAADDTVARARQLMTERALDVIAVLGEHGELLVMLCPRDLLGADIGDQQTLASITGSPLVTVEKDAGLQVAAACLRDSSHRCLPVVIGKTLVGTIDEACFVTIAIELMEQRQGEKIQESDDDDLDRRLDEAMGL